MQLAVTCGDPAGIGPEVVRMATRVPFDRADLVMFPSGEATPGHPSLETGRAALGAIDAAVDAALKKEVAGIVTAPVSKAHIPDFQGHTEYIAGRAGVRRPVMVFIGETYRVALVTRHAGIRKLPQILTADLVAHTIREFASGLRAYFGIAEPRLAVSAFNPHGREFGREEEEVIEPGMALSEVKCEGPFSADTIFRREGYDGIVSMYHDQALPVVKTLDPLAVNVTLGLPFVRTSPDHGTAFDIAGKGVADPAPMRRAIEIAADMVRATAPLL